MLCGGIKKKYSRKRYHLFCAASHVYDYDIAGRLTSWQKAGRGLTTVNESYGYNLSDELTRHETKNASTQATLDQRGWSYDAIGNWLSAGSPSNMTARSHNVMNRLTSTGGAGHTMVEGNVNAPSRGVRRRDRQPLGWGAAPRMRAEHPSQYADVKVNNQSVPLMADTANGGYRFRAKVPVTAGSNNVTIKATDPANEQTNQTWQFTAAATGKTYTYDANGNLLSDGTRTFTWDAKDRLRKIVVPRNAFEGDAWEWDYDYQDRRVREYAYSSNAAKPTIPTMQYIWERQQIVRERAGTSAIAGTVTRTHYTHAFVDPISGSNFILLPLKDHLGNVRELLGANIYNTPGAWWSPGQSFVGNTIAERWDYSAYQKPTRVSTPTNAGLRVNASLLVIGRYQNHAGSGLQLALYRGYDPDLGRWISEDPIAERGGLNLYGYVRNNPIQKIDALGLEDTAQLGYAGATAACDATAKAGGNTEYCGSICKKADGTLYNTALTKGDSGFCKPTPCNAGDTQVGIFHSHTGDPHFGGDDYRILKPGQSNYMANKGTGVSVCAKKTKSNGVPYPAVNSVKPDGTLGAATNWIRNGNGWFPR